MSYQPLPQNPSPKGAYISPTNQQQPNQQQQQQYYVSPTNQQQQQQQYYASPTNQQQQQQAYYVPPQQGFQQQQQQYQPNYQAEPLRQPASGFSDKDEGERFNEVPVYRDWFWGILFVVHLIAMIVISLYMYSKYHDELTGNCSKNDPNCNNNDVSIKVDSKFWSMIAIISIGGAVVSVFWLWMIKSFATFLIWFTLFFSVGLLVVSAGVCFALGSVAGGIICIIFAALNLWYIYAVRDRVAFSAIMLETVVSVISMFPAMVYYSLGSIVFQGGWMVIWALGTASIAHALDNSSSGNQGIVFFILAISFFWTSQVVKNVVHVTVAGGFASWYFLYPNNIPENPTNKSFKRAITTSFGSICLGSLFIAIIKAIRAMVQQARNSQNDFARACAECILSCIEQLVEFFNLYAFTQVAIYGKSYCEAAKATFQLLKSRGLDLIVNDNLISGVLSFAALIAGLTVGVIAGLVANFVVKSGDWGFYAAIGFIIGFGMALCAMVVVESCVASFFVCFAEDPKALADTKPEPYAKVTGALRQFYPSYNI